MAEVTAFRNNALPYPVYGLPWTVVFPILDADGDPVTGASGLDAEISKNGDTPADCTNESTEIGSSGQYYLSLTGTELTCDIASVVAKTSTSGAKTTCLVLYPRKLVSLRTGTAQTGASGSMTLDSGASPIDDYFNGCVLAITSGTGSGQARIISDYVGSTKVASVAVNWATNPDNTSVFAIYLPEGKQIGQADVVAYNNAAATSSGGRPEVNTTHFGGSALTQSGGRPEVNVSHFGGSALTQSGGRPEVNTTHFGGSALTQSGGRPEVNTTLIEGSDATNQIRDSVVDDATRIDASALNTLSSHDPGGTIASQTSVDDIPTNAELATALGTADDAVLAAVSTLQTSVNDIPTNAELATALGTADDAVLAAIAALPSAGEIADAVWEEDISDHSGTVGSTAEALDAAGASSPTAADIADAVWEESIADHSGTTGSTAEALGAAGAAGDPWTTVLPGSYGANSAGKIVGDFLDAAISTRASQTSVDDLPTNAELATALGTADDAVLAAVAALPSAGDVADAVLAADVEPNFSVMSALQISMASVSKVSGADTSTNVFRDPNDTRDVITSTVDADGNRSAVTFDVTG